MKKSAKKWAVGASIVSVVLSAITAVSVFAGLHNSKQTAEKANLATYRVGTIDYGTETSDGRILDSNHSVVFKEMKSIDGLKIDIEEDTATVNYMVAYYDADKNFLGCSSVLNVDYDSTEHLPETIEGAEYFRVIITPLPVDGEAVDINVFNINKYTSQLEVSWNKENN